MMRILFVCQGNTCRSPMAEALVERFGGGLVHAVSAGLRPGLELARHAKSVMLDAGIDLSSHHPKGLNAVEEPVDMVVSLCDVIAPGQDLFPKALRFRWRIPDPIGGSLEDYRRTRDLIWEQLRPLLERLTENHELPVLLATPHQASDSSTDNAGPGSA